MTQVIGCAVQLGGMPVPRGGGIRLVEALAAIVREGGGELRTERRRRAHPRRRRPGDRRPARRRRARARRRARSSRASRRRSSTAGCSTASVAPPEPCAARPRRFRYGRAGMQIHLALERAARVGVARGRAALADGDRARHAGPRRRLARRQRGRPRAAAGRGDDRRRPALRRRPEPRARRQAGSSGSSCRSCRAARAATRSARSTSATAPGPRSCARPTPTASSRGSARQITNLERATLKRVVLSPADLEALDCNLVGGDIYAGSCALDQNLLWRPTGGCPGHATPVDGPLADRRLDAPRARPRRGLGLPRREGADKPSLPERIADRVPGRRSGSSASGCPCEAVAQRDLDRQRVVRRGRRAYAAAGSRRHRHLGVQAPGRTTMRTSGCSSGRASASRTASPRSRRSCRSRSPGMEGPPDPAERIDALCASMARLAATRRPRCSA